jgi:hypothetical protein
MSETGAAIRPTRAVALGAEVDGCCYIYDPGGVMRILNTSASAIWRLCDGTRTVTDLVAELGRNHDADPDVLAADVVATVDELLRLGLLGQA